MKHADYIRLGGMMTDATPEWREMARRRGFRSVLFVPMLRTGQAIGTITKIVPETIEKIIITGDMDTLQLVDNSTFVYAMSRGVNDSILYDEKAVKEKGEKEAKIVRIITQKVLIKQLIS